MKKPKVVLKNVKMFEGHDGMGLNADIWINGVKCMHVYDSAHGGCFEYTKLTFNNPKADKVNENIKLLTEHIETLPPVKTKHGEFRIDLDMYVNTILDEQEKAKAQKKMNKLMTTAIVFGVPNGDGYQYINLKRPLSEVGKVKLEPYIAKIKNMYCTDGKVILNTNLKELGIMV